jgi:hypothetical protein
MSEADRMIILTDEDVIAKKEKLKNKNSRASEERAAKILRIWLETAELQLDFENFSDETLDSCLSKFWFGARTAAKQRYVEYLLLTITTVLDFINIR